MKLVVPDHRRVQARDIFDLSDDAIEYLRKAESKNHSGVHNYSLQTSKRKGATQAVVAY